MLPAVSIVAAGGGHVGVGTGGRRSCYRRPAELLLVEGGVAAIGARRCYHKRAEMLPKVLALVAVVLPLEFVGYTIGERRCYKRKAAMLPSVAALLLAGVVMLQRSSSGSASGCRRCAGGALVGVNGGRRCYHGTTAVLPMKDDAAT
jgi:hypothetical protein